jgi:serine/threonine protein kinase
VRQPIPFGKYLLLERINVGGMAEIFLARSRGVQGFNRILAIKKILPTMAEDEEFIVMFIDEARIAAELSHAGIVQIFELGKFEDDYYIAMEFIHGKDLRFIQERQAREKCPMDVNLAAHIAFKICEALDYAHTKKDPTGKPMGIVHRDISPQNVILSYDGEVRICDFGIAKAANRSQKTQAGVLKGKFGYMSPEQVRGLPLDGRSDIFTVGTLLYELLTLSRLFIGESDFSTLEKVRNADVVPPSTYNRDVPEELEEIVLLALSKEVEDRHQGAAEMADALQMFMINNTLASTRDVSAFMCKSFEAEFEAELRRLEEYQDMTEPCPGELVRSSEDLPGMDFAEDADPDAKTLIFASADADAELRSVPPPLPSSRKKPDAELVPFAAGKADLGDAATKIIDSDDKPELADAKTMIFVDPEAQPEVGLHELPTKVPGTGTGQKPSGPVPSGKPLSNRLFIPLAFVAALLLGYSIFTTIQLSQQSAPNAGPPVFELMTRPAGGVQVSVDGIALAKSTPFATRVLSAGEHHLSLRLHGTPPIERTIRLIAGERLVMEIDLSPPSHKATEGRPGVDKPSVEKPLVDKPLVDKPLVDKPLVGKPLVDKPLVGKPPVEKPPVVAKVTTVLVESVPKGATLLLNGTSVGTTPWTGTVKPDEMARLYLRKSGYQPASKNIQPKAGEQNRVRLVLARKAVSPPPAKKEYGYLLANTRPWSKVHVDGRYTGRETPIPPDKKLRLTTGKHKVTFEVPGGKNYEFNVEIQTDKTLKLIKRLE